MEEKDQIVPDLTDEFKPKKNVDAKHQVVANSVKVIHESFQKIIQYTSNETFRQQMLKKVEARNPRMFSEKLANHLIMLTRDVHNVDVEKSFLLNSKCDIDSSETEDELEECHMTQGGIRNSLESTYDKSQELISPNADECQLSQPYLSSQASVSYFEELLGFSAND